MFIIIDIFMYNILLYCQRFCHRPITFVSMKFWSQNEVNSTTFKASDSVLRRFGGGCCCISNAQYQYKQFRDRKQNIDRYYDNEHGQISEICVIQMMRYNNNLHQFSVCMTAMIILLCIELATYIFDTLYTHWFI